MSSVSPAGGAEGSAGSGLGAVRFSFVDFSFRLKTECQLRHTFSSPPAPFQEAFARDILRKVPEGRDSHLVFWRPLFCDGKKALSDAPRARDGSVLRYKLCKLRSPWALTVLWTSFKIFPRKIFFMLFSAFKLLPLKFFCHNPCMAARYWTSSLCCFKGNFTGFGMPRLRDRVPCEETG